jgi:hypothetical protein
MGDYKRLTASELSMMVCVVTLCDLVDGYSTLKMGAIYFSETMVNPTSPHGIRTQ